MGKEDVYQVYREAPNAILIASYLEATSHCLLSRKELREVEKGIKELFLVPEDDS